MWASHVAQLVKNPPVMWETWDQSLGGGDPLEKGKATHSSILAWRIPWTVQSFGLQRVRHEWATELNWADAHIHIFSGTGDKEPACQCRSLKRCRFDPWVGKTPWRRHSNPLRHSCLENPMIRGAWWATVPGVAKSWTWLNDSRFHFFTG